MRVIAMKSHHDLPEPIRMRIILEMIRLRDKHIAEIRKLLDSDLETAIQVESQLRYGLPPR